MASALSSHKEGKGEGGALPLVTSASVMAQHGHHDQPSTAWSKGIGSVVQHFSPTVFLHCEVESIYSWECASFRFIQHI